MSDPEIIDIEGFGSVELIEITTVDVVEFVDLEDRAIEFIELDTPIIQQPPQIATFKLATADW